MEDLIALQKSAKPIRNPFGSDFKTTWNKVEVTLPADGKWHTFVGVLADHITRHLWMKVTYRLHDRETLKLKSAGRDRDARKFQLSDVMKNKVWMVITGQPHPKFKNGTIEPDNMDDIDFSILEKDMKEIDAQAVMAAQTTSVSEVLQQASDAALREISLAGGDSAHAQGSVNFGAPVDPNAGSLPVAPLASADSLAFLQPEPGVEKKQSAPEDSITAPEFPSISQLD